MSVLFAATYPDRTAALILYGSYARRAWSPDNPWGRKQEDLREFIDVIKRDWGGPVVIEAYAPSGVQDEAFRRWYANNMRLSVSPGQRSPYSYEHGDRRSACPPRSSGTDAGSPHDW